MRRVVFLTVAAVIGTALSADGQSSDVEQKVREQFSLTKVTADRSDITAQGTVVTLRKDGLWAYSTASPVPYLNTYNEKGKISQPFMANLGAGVAGGLSSNNTNYPYLRFTAGEKFSIIALFFKNGITFLLYSDPHDGIRYYSQLTFPFKKGADVTPDEALAKIAEILTLQSADTHAQLETNPRLAEIAGEYVLTKAANNRLQLNSDGTLSLVQKGRNYSGTFTVTGNTLRYQIGRGSSTVTLQGETIIDQSGSTWVREKEASVPLPLLKLPATYVSTQAPADQLQLNADNSFSLQEGGEPYHGNFAVNGNRLEITITDTGIKTPMTIQGSNLTDPSGQTWVLRAPK